MQVAGRDEVDSLGVGGRAKRTVKPGHESAEGRGFSLDHVSEVDEVAAGDDLHGARR
jgi:hypothetical protein